MRQATEHTPLLRNAYSGRVRLHVLFFGVLRDRFGAEERLEQFPGQTVADVLRYYRVIAPDLGGLWETVAVAVNQQYTAYSATLAEDDEIALLPPVSGGCFAH